MVCKALTVEWDKAEYARIDSDLLHLCIEAIYFDSCDPNAIANRAYHGLWDKHGYQDKNHYSLVRMKD